MRFLPRSLLGQTLTVVAIALLVAQLASAVLLVRAAENRRLAVAVNATANLQAYDAPLAVSARSPREEQRWRALQRRGRFPIEVSQESPAFIAAGQIDARATEAVAEILGEISTPPHAVHSIVRKASADPYLRDRQRPAMRRRASGWSERQILVTAVQPSQASPWFVTRVPLPRTERGMLAGIVLQTGVLFLVLMAVLYLLLRRITRPLAQLSGQVELFTRTLSSAEPLASSGPHDVARLIAAHNTMEARISSMLEEKDVMLGAIGHDLKTPLAALRVRIESIEDEVSRDKMATSIEEITQTLDDILSLARVGKSNVPPEPTELSALTQSVVEEFEDLEQPVELAETQRVVAPVHVNWLKRALRNLIANAIRYGGKARVGLAVDPSMVTISVEDAGPGIPEDKIQAMFEPFRRGEASRNRDTGGAGLGLTLARAIAEQHGGSLILSNREEGGLRAEIRLPLDSEGDSA
ncbi:sensor histidine kinase [Altererythrobacter sp. MF3-039]|uniref:sensor histidine kinase n=1 Tax=Altererythrobacter sp. MF3-039 TaxID=3252901 RepID=UPI00390C69A2